jgi:predicted amidophosphoribosyltransferase
VGAYLRGEVVRPKQCWNCGAPWKPKCDYCGTVYECDPPHDPFYLTVAQAQRQAMSQSQLAQVQGALYLSGPGLLGALTGIKF